MAVGAAIQTAELPPPDVKGQGIRLSLNVPRTSNLPAINIGGQIRTDGEDSLDTSLASQLTVLLTTPRGDTLGPARLNENFSFIFEAVELQEEESSEFTVQVSDRSGLQRASQSFSVEYISSELKKGTTEIHITLPKSVYIKTAAGLEMIAKEGVSLPHKCKFTRKRLHTEPSLEIKVFQKDDEVGIIGINDIPADAGEGCPVVVTVEITQKNEMRGTAVVKTRSGSVAGGMPRYASVFHR